MSSLISILLLALFSATASAQFGFFDQMFGGGGGGGGGQQQQARQQQQRQQQNVPSDSSLYQQNYDHYPCENYLCPDTLACVHFPHHCPCPFPANEDKFETGDGHRLCVSKGGFKAGEAARKVELARKGLL
ncbi:Long chronological lifespan protein [Apiospora arundinis]